MASGRALALKLAGAFWPKTPPYPLARNAFDQLYYQSNNLTDRIDADQREHERRLLPDETDHHLKREPQPKQRTVMQSTHDCNLP